LKAMNAGAARVLSSIRYLLADVIGDDDGEPPLLPDGLPDGAAAVVSDGIHRLVDYQSAGYAQLYVDRLRRFVGRRGVDDAMFGEIARLMAIRMSYEDPIRIAQSKLAEYEIGADGPLVQPTGDTRKFRLDELIGALPAIAAEPVLDVLEWVEWTHKPVSISFSGASRWGVRGLKIEASLRRWRLFSVRYARERVWVERWLHMIDRALTKQPAAAPAIVQTATMIDGRPCRRRRRSACRGDPRSAAGRAQAHHRGNQGAGAVQSWAARRPRLMRNCARNRNR
jgi:hypothetical protein